MQRGAAAHLNAMWVGMAFDFDFDGHTGTMGQATIASIEPFKKALMTAYGYGSATAYRHVGITSMNGKTDVKGETVTITDFNTILAYARKNHLARFTFWSLNRDRRLRGRKM